MQHSGGLPGNKASLGETGREGEAEVFSRVTDCEGGIKVFFSSNLNGVPKG